MMDSSARTRRPLISLRQPFCGWSHFFGAVLGLAAVIVLIVLAWGKPAHIASFVIYGVSLVGLYLASAFYHSFYRKRGFWQRMDHIAIFGLIAGTYTPVCMVALRETMGLPMLIAQWGLAAIGTVAVVIGKTPHWLRVTLYVVMGWMAVIAVPPLREALPGQALTWMFAGGVAYSIGLVILATDRPRLWPGKFGSHDLWHIFVLTGSACHFLMMLIIARSP